MSGSEKVGVASEKVGNPQPNALNLFMKSNSNKEQEREHRTQGQESAFKSLSAKECGAASRPVFVRHLRPFGARAHRRASARRRKRLGEKGGGERSRSNDLGRNSGKSSKRPMRGRVPHGATQSTRSPLRGSAPLRGVLRTGFDSAALCGVLKASGTKGVPDCSTACGASKQRAIRS